MLFGVALFNFVTLWYAAHHGPQACLVCPWYRPWSYLNEPTLILVATLALLFSRKWTDAIAVGLSGYLVWEIIYRFWYYNLSVIENVGNVFGPYQKTLHTIQVQWLLAFLVFFAATFYLGRALIIGLRTVSLTESTRPPL
jgi:hypothetical protein